MDGQSFFIDSVNRSVIHVIETVLFYIQSDGGDDRPVSGRPFRAVVESATHLFTPRIGEVSRTSSTLCARFRVLAATMAIPLSFQKIREQEVAFITGGRFYIVWYNRSQVE